MPKVPKVPKPVAAKKKATLRDRTPVGPPPVPLGCSKCREKGERMHKMPDGVRS